MCNPGIFYRPVGYSKNMTQLGAHTPQTQRRDTRGKYNPLHLITQETLDERGILSDHRKPLALSP